MSAIALIVVAAFVAKAKPPPEPMNFMPLFDEVLSPAFPSPMRIADEMLYVPPGRETVPPPPGSASIAACIAAVSSVEPSPFAPNHLTFT